MSGTTDLYRTFFAVGMFLSFSKAAKEIGVSQSAISQSIKQLERELNMPLFHRTTKSVSFTAEGKELFESVSKAFSILDTSVAHIQERLAHEKGVLSLAATDTLCRKFLLPYLKTWQKERHHGLNIVNRMSMDCVHLVEEGEVELAVVSQFDGLTENPQFEVVQLGHIHDVFIGGPSYKNRGLFDKEAIMAEPMLLLSKGASSRSFFEGLVGDCEPAFELSSLDVLLDLVSIDLGISLVPDIMLDEKIANGSIVRLDTNLPIPARNVVLVWSRTKPLSLSASKFVDLLVSGLKHSHG